MGRDEMIRDLKEGLEELRADPFEEEEMMETLRNVPRDTPPARWRVRATAAAAVLLVGAGLAYLIAGGEEPTRLAEGPQVAGMDEMAVRPPPLRVSRSESWDRERYRVVQEIRPEEIVTRLSYEPADGGERVRHTPRGKWPPLPRPKGAPEDALVAVLAAADPDLPWRRVRETVAGGPLGVLYLAGTEPDGTVGAIAATVPTTPGQFAAMREIRRLGAAVTPKDLANGFPDDRVLQLRITRGDGGTRFRFGLHPYVKAIERFVLGDVTRSDDDLAGGGRLALPGLAAWVAGDGPRPRRGIAFLEAGTGVRYVDVLRALESLQGVWLLDLPTASRDLDLIRLPEPATDGDAAALFEIVGGFSPMWVNVLADGTLRVRGAVVDPESFEMPPERSHVFLRADQRAPWPVCRTILDRAIAAGCHPTLVFAPEDPEIPWERGVRLPPAAEVRRTVPVELTVLPDGNTRWTSPHVGPDIAVLLRVSDGATAGQVQPLILHLIRAGAASIRFE